MGRIIAVANQKGGVGKTTTSINLSASLAATKKRVILIDLDPQGNATTGSGIDKNGLEIAVGELLNYSCKLEELIHKTKAGYDLLPTNPGLTAAEVNLLQSADRELRLKQSLKESIDRYDYLIIDCPPALNILTLNALVAANSLLIPMQCEYYALEGLSGLLNTVSQISAELNPKLEIEGILRTMYDMRNRLATDVSEQLLDHFGDKVFSTVIPRNVRLAEAPSYGVPALLYDKNSTGAIAYLALAGEILRRQQEFLTTN